MTHLDGHATEAKAGHAAISAAAAILLVVFEAVNSPHFPTSQTSDDRTDNVKNYVRPARKNKRENDGDDASNDKSYQGAIAAPTNI